MSSYRAEPNETNSQMFGRMYQDSAAILQGISSGKYQIKIYRNTDITDLSTLSDIQILSFTQNIFNGNDYIFDLLAHDFRLNGSYTVSMSELHGINEEYGIEYPSAYGISTKSDVFSYLSDYFTSGYIESRFSGSNENELAKRGNWYEFKDNVYFGYFHWGIRGASLDPRSYKIERPTDHTLVVHAKNAISDLYDEDILDYHFYFVLEDGRLKLNEFRYGN